MNKRPLSIFNLTADQAITLLETSADELEDPSDRYIAASQLVNHPGERSIQALISAIGIPVTDLNSRIVRRKAVETLGYLKAAGALPILQDCLQDEDGYTVQNAVWSIGEIGTQDPKLLEAITALLQQPNQNYRLIIQTLAKLDYKPAAKSIQTWVDAEDPTISGAAISAIYQLAGDESQMFKVVELLQHSSVNARRSCIQDLIDAKQYGAIPQIIRCPVSMVFRLRGVRQLTEQGITNGALTFTDIEAALDQTIRDHPNDLDLVHEYDQKPSLEFLLKELYETDFSRCYLATQTLLESYSDSAPAALLEEFSQRARGDYGAHYHVIKLFGWLRYEPAYPILVEALHNPAPQFKKSRAAAALSLAELECADAVPELQAALNSSIWQLNYACLLALKQLEKFAVKPPNSEFTDFFVREKYLKLLSDK